MQIELLSSMYRLKYQENKLDTLQLAKELGLDPFECLQVQLDLEKQLHNQLGVVDEKSLETICPHCLRAFNDRGEAALRVDDKGEKYCTVCYVVAGSVNSEQQEQEETFDESLPFDQPFGRPTCDSTIQRGLGDTLPQRHMTTDGNFEFDRYDNNLQHLISKSSFGGCHVSTCSLGELKRVKPKVVKRLTSAKPVAVETENGLELRVAGEPYVFDEAHVYRLRWDVNGLELVDRVPIKDFQAVANGAFDTLLMRTQKVRSLANQESKGIDGLLLMASDVEKRLNLLFDSPKDKKFGNSVGANIRRCYRLCEEYGIKVPRKTLVESMVYLTLKQFKKTAAQLQAKNMLDIDECLIDKVWQLSYLIDQLMLNDQ